MTTKYNRERLERIVAIGLTGGEGQKARVAAARKELERLDREAAND